MKHHSLSYSFSPYCIWFQIQNSAKSRNQTLIKTNSQNSHGSPAPGHFITNHIYVCLKISLCREYDYEVQNKWDFSIPICSMYGIFTNICPKNHPNVGKYTIHGAYGIGIWGLNLERSLHCIDSQNHQSAVSAPRAGSLPLPKRGSTTP